MADRNEWETPQWLVDYFEPEFHFTLDPCATEINYKCDRYFTKQENGLVKPWGKGFAFVNPPYGKGLLDPWIKKAFVEVALKCGSLLLLPARTERGWFHYCLENATELILVEGRVNYIPPPGVKKSSNRENTIIFILKPGRKRRLIVSRVHVRELKKGSLGKPRIRIK